MCSKAFLDFLADIFEQGYKHRLVCSDRSTISEFHQGIEVKLYESTNKLLHLIIPSYTYNEIILSFGMFN